ncbi:MAG TPA: hypothetical protein VGB64_11620 [Actinomycetota bacterium]
MVRCDMCGMEVPAGPNGKCFLGHALPGGIAVTPVATVPAPAPLPQPVPAAVVSAPMGEPVAPQPDTVFAPAAQASAFPTSISPDLIAAAVAEAEGPAAQPPAATSGFTAPRPLGDAQTGFTPPQPLGAPATSIPSMPSTQPAPLSSVPMPVAPPPMVASPTPLAMPAAAAQLPTTHGTAALAVDPAVAVAVTPPAPAGDLFIVSSGSEKRAPNKTLLLVLVFAMLGGAAFAAKSFLAGGGDAATGAAGNAPAHVREAGSLTRAFVADETNRYLVTADITTSFREGTESKTFAATMNMTFSERVVGRAEDGSTKIRYTFDSATVNAEGRQVAVPIPPGTGVEVLVGPDGKVRSAEQIGGGELPMDDNSFHGMLAPVLPPGVKPGDRWTRVDNLSLPTVGDMKVTSVFHYAKDEGPNAVVDSSSEVPFSLSMGAEQLGELAGGSAGPVEMRGRLLAKGRQTVEKATGRTVAAEMDMTMTFAIFESGAEAGRMAMKMKMKLGPAPGVSAKAA